MSATFFKSFLGISFLALLGSQAHAQQTPQQKEAQQLFLKAQKSTDTDDALEACRQAVALAPMNDTYLAYLAKLEAQNGDLKNSLSHARAAAAIKPNNPAYLGLVMRGSLAERDYVSAKEFAGKLVELGSIKAGKTLYDEAKTLHAKADGMRADAIFSRAFNDRNAVDMKPAIAALVEVAKSDPKNKVYGERLLLLEPLKRAAELDVYALETPPDAELTLDSLANHLIVPGKTEAEKARLIYRWMTDRIAFDFPGHLARKTVDQDAETVLKKRVALGVGFSELYFQLAKRAGLEVSRVPGVCRGFAWQPTPPDAPMAHAWNAVKADGKWGFVDPAWGSGSLDGKRFYKRFDEEFLLTPPDRMIFTHFPDDKRAQLLDPPTTREQFDKWPSPGRLLFKTYPSMTPEKLRTLLAEKNARFPKMYDSTLAYSYVNVPLTAKLTAGKQYRFEIDAPGCETLTFTINFNQEILFTRKDTHFEGRLTPRRGTTVMIRGRKVGDLPNTYFPLIAYEVE